MTLAQPRTASIVGRGGHHLLDGRHEHLAHLAKACPLDEAAGERRQEDPHAGVFTQVNVTVAGFGPAKIVTELANGARAPFTAGTRLEVPMSSRKIKMKHDHARRAPGSETGSPGSICIW